MLSGIPQPQLAAVAPAPPPPPSTASASTWVMAPVASTPNRVPEHLMLKNRLQEYAQRSHIPLPIYQSHNEGYEHAPKFRASVLVDGVTYTSPNTFSHRKAAEQDVAKIALECICKKIKDGECPLINVDTVFCKSILNEFAVKMNLEMPAYSTKQSEALIPVFVSSLVFNGITYTGEAGRRKKEAEQLAAQAVIRMLLVTSESATILSEIIKSKVKLDAALNKVKESNYSAQNIANSYVPTAAISDSSTGIHPIAARSYMPHHEFKMPKKESSSETVSLPITFVPPILGQPSGVGPSSANKRRKNKKKANKRVCTYA